MFIIHDLLVAHYYLFVPRCSFVPTKRKTKIQSLGWAFGYCVVSLFSFITPQYPMPQRSNSGVHAFI
ncbi:hypothetical protein BU24DRAFT_424408 [Aaosphaeria arxii CBS 175.79]|uniref:Uncharacterized protein n=1 Tax=Aaosphaeria arxii CBS 175.79 TaxID=1450172 RepID=A0A6A5XJG3_9PLEO|nr:uncharacterized protein BU24DRAFT_424408 [Aaosphaeria arxii CBS 175.79]KAF2013408.1 hypothetical protein BU24DRAFT_424408 [Aaosphaeria arxii CBS 175.79]